MNRIWITRTAPGASTMAHRLRYEGVNTIVCPLIEIEKIDVVQPKVAFDLAVFLSQHAVHHSDVASIGAKHILAIGRATQRALATLNVASRLPRQSNSEGLLSEVSSTLRRGSSVLIVCGEDGRNFLSHRLQDAGYDVKCLAVYRRRFADRLPRCVSLCSMVELSSMLALDRFVAVAKRQSIWDPFNPSLLFASRRIAIRALKVGLEKLYVVGDASPRSFAHVVRRLTL